MVSVPALARALHPAVARKSGNIFGALDIWIFTIPAPPPVQLIVSPVERATVRFAALAGLVNVGSGGIVRVALNGRTLLPPGPVMVNSPGTRKLPAVPIVDGSPLLYGTVAFPLGPLSMKLAPPSSPLKPVIPKSSLPGLDSSETRQVPGGGP